MMTSEGIQQAGMLPFWKLFYRYFSAGNHAISMKFGAWTQICSKRRSRTKYQNLANSKWRTGCHIEKSFFGYMRAIYCPIGWKFGMKKQNHCEIPSLCLLSGPPRFFQIVWRRTYPLNFPLATPVYLCVCVKHVNNELRDINVNTLYSI